MLKNLQYSMAMSAEHSSKCSVFTGHGYDSLWVKHYRVGRNVLNKNIFTFAPYFGICIKSKIVQHLFMFILLYIEIMSTVSPWLLVRLLLNISEMKYFTCIAYYMTLCKTLLGSSNTYWQLKHDNSYGK